MLLERRVEGGAPPLQGGVTSRLKLLCAVLDPHWTDALALVFHTECKQAKPVYITPNNSNN